MAESGDKGALAALALLNRPTHFLSTVQVGITSIGVLNGIVGDAAFSGGLSAWLQGLGVPLRAAEISGYCHPAGKTDTNSCSTVSKDFSSA